MAEPCKSRFMRRGFIIMDSIDSKQQGDSSFGNALLIMTFRYGSLSNSVQPVERKYSMRSRTADSSTL